MFWRTFARHRADRSRLLPALKGKFGGALQGIPSEAEESATFGRDTPPGDEGTADGRGSEEGMELAQRRRVNASGSFS
jgi:hypothetical protein